jgi:hypothetical protein
MAEIRERGFNRREGLELPFRRPHCCDIIYGCVTIELRDYRDISQVVETRSL